MSIISSFENTGTAFDFAICATPIIFVPVYTGEGLDETGPVIHGLTRVSVGGVLAKGPRGNLFFGVAVAVGQLFPSTVFAFVFLPRPYTHSMY
jgi:hypothetical protein